MCASREEEWFAVQDVEFCGGLAEGERREGGVRVSVCFGGGEGGAVVGLGLGEEGFEVGG